MAAIDTINRIFREFKRYTGDGLPSEPTGAALPIGDPSSGVHNPKKSEIRAGMTEVLSDAEASAAEAAQHATDAEAAKDAIENGFGEFTGRALIHDLADTVGYDAGSRNLINVDGLSMSAVLEIDAGGGINIGTGTPFGDISVMRTRTAMDWHAFEDWGTLDISAGAAEGYSSFDAKPTLDSSVEQGHFVGYQARNTVVGAGDISDYLDGFNSALVLNGSGTIAAVHHFRVRTPTVGIDQAITNAYGFYCEDLTNTGFNHFGFFSADPNNLFNGLQVTNDLTVNGFLTSASTSVAFGLPAALKSYTYANLPTAPEGSVAYCTNGRKSFEGVGAGTGVPVYFADAAWRKFSDDLTVEV